MSLTSELGKIITGKFGKAVRNEQDEALDLRLVEAIKLAARSRGTLETEKQVIGILSVDGYRPGFQALTEALYTALDPAFARREGTSVFDRTVSTGLIHMLVASGAQFTPDVLKRVVYLADQGVTEYLGYLTALPMEPMVQKLLFREAKTGDARRLIADANVPFSKEMLLAA